MKKKHLTILIIVTLTAGCAMLCYPAISDYINSVRRTADISAYSQTVSELDSETGREMLDSANAYNAELAQKPAHWKLNEEEIESYDLQLDIDGSGIMSYVEIPKLGCSLPVYHGTSVDVLQIAVGHLEGSSLPVGGTSTHSVLSAHRGLPSAKLFSNLDQLEKGDRFTVCTLGQALCYEVDDISIVLPYDTQKLQIVQGEDLCTLMTCTPYGVNTHRLLVRGHRVDDSKSEVRVTADALQIDPLIVAPVLAVPFLIAIIVAIIVYQRKRKV